MASILNYIRERFPLPLALIFSFILVTAIDFYLFSGIRGDAAFYVSAFLLTLFLFRVRLGDDIKDIAYDARFHRDRAVQRGMVTRGQLARALFATLAAEMALQAFLFPGAVFLYLFLVLYWFLMFKDFFNKSLESRHFLLYILLHQVIFAFYVYYFFCVAVKKVFLPGTGDLAVIFFLFLCMFIYEVSRKMNDRHDTEGNITSDTYVYRWGKKNVMLLLTSFLILQISSVLFVFERVNIFLAMYAALAGIGFMRFSGKSGPAYFIFLIVFGLATFISYYFI